MRIARALGIAAATMAVLAAGYGEPAAPSSEHGSGVADELADRVFFSVKITDDAGPVQLVRDTWIVIAFSADGYLSARAGCNTLGTQVFTAGGVLKTTTFGQTEMGCAPEWLAQDRWLQRFLADRPSWTLDRNYLTVTGQTVEIVLLDREIADPDWPLQRTRWVVETIHFDDPGAAVDETAGTAWLRIDGRAFTAGTGCRQVSGSVHDRGRTLRFREPLATAADCRPEQALLDRAMMAILSQDAGYTVVGDRLHLDPFEGGGLILVADVSRGPRPR